MPPGLRACQARPPRSACRAAAGAPDPLTCTSAGWPVHPPGIFCRLARRIGAPCSERRHIRRPILHGAPILRVNQASRGHPGPRGESRGQGRPRTFAERHCPCGDHAAGSGPRRARAAAGSRDLLTAFAAFAAAQPSPPAQPPPPAQPSRRARLARTWPRCRREAGRRSRRRQPGGVPAGLRLARPWAVWHGRRGAAGAGAGYAVTDHRIRGQKRGNAGETEMSKACTPRSGSS